MRSGASTSEFSSNFFGSISALAIGEKTRNPSGASRRSYPYDDTPAEMMRRPSISRTSLGSNGLIIPFSRHIFKIQRSDLTLTYQRSPFYRVLTLPAWRDQCRSIAFLFRIPVKGLFHQFGFNPTGSQAQLPLTVVRKRISPANIIHC